MLTPPPHPRPPLKTLADPTLVVFTLGSEAEARRKQLLGPAHYDLERTLFASELQRLLACGEEAGYRLAVAAPRPTAAGHHHVERVGQPSGSFGRRLAGSIALACPDPTAPWVVVGLDCPELGEGLLRRTRNLLRSDPADRRVVLGPSRDGGLYLIAANRPLAALLQQASWGHRRTAQSLRRLLLDAGLEIVELPLLGDLDCSGDLWRWLSKPTGHASPSAGPGSTALRRAIRRRLARPPAAAVAERVSAAPTRSPVGSRAPPN